MEFLKEFLGDELYAQVEAKLKGNDKIKIANLASGEYVSKSKYDDKVTELATANTTIGQLKEAAEKYEGTDIDGLKTQLANAQTKYDTDTKKLKDDIKKRDAVDAWLDKHPTRHRNLMRSQFDYSKLKVDGDNVTGIDEIGKQLTDTYADMFNQDDGGDGGQGGDGGMTHGRSPKEKDPGEMSMEEYKAWREKQ